jgi:hypothetical protein
MQTLCLFSNELYAVDILLLFSESEMICPVCNRTISVPCCVLYSLINGFPGDFLHEEKQGAGPCYCINHQYKKGR